MHDPTVRVPTVRLGGRAWVWYLLSFRSCSGCPASEEKAPQTKSLLLPEQGYSLPTQGASRRQLERRAAEASGKQKKQGWPSSQSTVNGL